MGAKIEYPYFDKYNSLSEVFGARLKYLRKKEGLTQHELAERLTEFSGMKWSYTFISRLETGGRRISCAMIIFLVLYFKTSADWLLGIDEMRESEG